MEKFRKIITISFILTLFSISNGAFSQKKERLAVLTLDVKNIDEDFKNLVLTYIENAIVNSDKYAVVERDAIEAILKEHKFSQSDLVDTKKIARLGKFLGANKIVIGKLFYVNNVYTLNLKLLDVETAVIDSSALNETGESKNLRIIVTKTVEKLLKTKIKEVPKKEEIKKEEKKKKDKEDLGLTIKAYMGSGSMASVGVAYKIFVEIMLSFGYVTYEKNEKTRSGIPIGLRVSYYIPVAVMDIYAFGTGIYGLGISNYNSRFGGGGGAGLLFFKMLFAEGSYLLTPDGNGIAIGLGAQYTF